MAAVPGTTNMLWKLPNEVCTCRFAGSFRVRHPRSVNTRKCPATSGRLVSVHNPCSSFCIGRRLPPMATATSFAFGARSLNVTRPSVATSGDFTGGAPRPPRPAGAAV